MTGVLRRLGGDPAGAPSSGGVGWAGGGGSAGRRRPRLGRRRRLVAALVAALGILFGYFAIRPVSGAPVLVAARDLSPGPLRPGDLRTATLAQVPDGAVRSGAVGQVLASAMRRGEPLTDVRLLRSAPLPTGTVAAPVRIPDAQVARLLSPGSTIGVYAAWENQAAQLVADDVTVVTIPRGDDDHGALLVLAATPAQAGQLAAAQAGGRLSITIKPRPPGLPA
ncbi:SAF domain-containing protein [Nonomuraea sp. NPDC000554]|uniref:SAF domain-containing protein n=1 Tax=Nonomuraea sp. NPDC000554 TaxID=3154259 RepID=UPI00331F4708